MRSVVFGLMLAPVYGAFATTAVAEPTLLQCKQQDIGQAVAAAPESVTLRYDGDASGTVLIQGPFGEMSLPATKEARDGTVAGVNDGKPYTVVGIRGSGPAVVAMPDKADVETCITSGLTPESAKDADLVFMAAMSCTSKTPQGANPVPVIASIEIAIGTFAGGKPEVMSVFMKRSYAEPSSLPSGPITIESGLNCELAAP